jgi:hypothetical protein
LPEADREAFVTQFARTIEASADVDNFLPVGTLLRQWQNTAEVWADSRLRTPIEADIEEGPLVDRPAAVGK